MFGYLRGKYSKDELKEIDAYAKSRSVELIPCVQVLAHIKGIFRHWEYKEIKDIDDILFGIEQDVDFIAASFVRTADDIREIKTLLRDNGGRDIRIIAKIENAEGVDNIDDIIRETHGIMVARGDMGVEIDMHDLPVLQKSLI